MIACLSKLLEGESKLKDVSPEDPFCLCYRVAQNLPDLNLYATRSLLSTNPAAIQVLVYSQNLFPSLPHGTLCASVTSLASRLPPFDFAMHDNRPYLYIKSSAIVFARYAKKPSLADLVIVIPTDEDRLKIILIPVSLVEQELRGASKMKTVRQVLNHLEVVKTSSGSGDKLSILMPSFSLKT